ncbi:MAG: S1 RNA-binding domain-containing protein, partial [Solirubrobacteraceae bacterium]|nr:S1 RNA-binding domain-containing protein [Solirubrobacteraceae bacterium]
ATGTVTTVRKAGAELDLASGHPAFVSIGHLIQHGEVFHAADVLQEGQEVQVRVGAWNPHAGRLSVTMREFAPDPWERLAEVYEPGMLIEGGVSGVTDFGAFVELLPGVEGLLHKSKISDDFVEYVDDYVRPGDRITVRLLDLDPDRQKAGVSLRDVPRGAEPVPPASIFPGGPPWLPMPDGASASDGGADDERGDDLADANDDAELDGDDAGWKPFQADDSPKASNDSITHAAVVAAAVAASDPGLAEAPASAIDDDLPGAPYGDQLALLFSLIEENGADGALAEAIRDALERGITTFDAALDEVDEGSEDEDDPLVQLRNAAADLIDALRVDDTDDPDDATEAVVDEPAETALDADDESDDAPTTWPDELAAADAGDASDDDDVPARADDADSLF